MTKELISRTRSIRSRQRTLTKLTKSLPKLTKSLPKPTKSLPKLTKSLLKLPSQPNSLNRSKIHIVIYSPTQLSTPVDQIPLFNTLKTLIRTTLILSTRSMQYCRPPAFEYLLLRTTKGHTVLHIGFDRIDRSALQSHMVFWSLLIVFLSFLIWFLDRFRIQIMVFLFLSQLLRAIAF